VGADDGLPKIPFTSAAAWEEWLEDDHAVSEGVWIKMAKKDSGIESVRYPEVLEIALCFGWIDGRREALDERYFLQRYTPRRSRSKWSRINRNKAERLIAEGRMRPAGLSVVGPDVQLLDDRSQSLTHDTASFRSARGRRGPQPQQEVHVDPGVPVLAFLLRTGGQPSTLTLQVARRSAGRCSALLLLHVHQLPDVTV
jgi:hypothetical protein